MPISKWIDRGKRLLTARRPVADSPPSTIERGESFLVARLRNRELGSRAPANSLGMRLDGDGEPFLALDVISALGAQISNKDRRRLVARLLRTQRKGAWAYSPRTGIDVDSTASAIRALDRLGHEISLEGLRLFFSPATGLYNTFHDAAFADPELGLQLPPHAFWKHKGCHPCVLANVYLLLRERGELSGLSPDLLRRLQKPDGNWFSYYYPSPFYATRLFTELLTSMGANYDGHMRMTLDALLATQPPNSSTQAAEIMISLDCLRRRFPDDGNAIGTMAAILVSRLGAAQLDDGSWPGDIIWESAVKDEKLEYAADHFRVRSTALCIRALKAWT